MKYDAFFHFIKVLLYLITIVLFFFYENVGVYLILNMNRLPLTDNPLLSFFVGLIYGVTFFGIFSLTIFPLIQIALASGEKTHKLLKS